MTLEFKAVQYTTSASPLTISQDSLNVSKGPDGNYVVGPTQVLVKIKCAALNPVDSVKKNVTMFPMSLKTKGIGFDYSGVVVGIGEKAAEEKGLRIGSKVCGMFQEMFGRGTLAEYALLDITTLLGATIHEIPEGLTFQEAASYPLVFGTAVLMFKDVPQQNKKRRILIMGAGTTVGKLCVQIAKNVHGYEDVVVTCSPKSIDLVRSLGADTWIDYTATRSILNPVLESVKANGKFDVILDCAGSADLFPEIQHILAGRKDGGLYVTISGDFKYSYTKPSFLQVLWNDVWIPGRLLRSRLGLLDYTYSFVNIIGTRHPWQNEAKEYIGSKKVQLQIDSVYPFAEVEKAFERVGSNQANGKVIVNVEDGA